MSGNDSIIIFYHLQDDVRTKSQRCLSNSRWWACPGGHLTSYYLHFVQFPLNYSYIIYVLSLMYGEDNEYDRERKLLQRGIEIAQNNPLLYLALGEMYDRKEEYNTAIDYYKRVLEFTEEEVEKDFKHMNQYFHMLVDYFPNSLEEAREEAKKAL